MSEKRTPNYVVNTRMTEAGLREQTSANRHGYAYLRHCVGILKKYSHDELFSEYSKIKDNRESFDLPKNKTDESRKAAYTFATEKAQEHATSNLVGHARRFLARVSTDDSLKVEGLDGVEGTEAGDKLALQIAGQLASEHYDRLWSAPGASTVTPLDEDTEDDYEEEEDYEDEEDGDLEF